MYNRMLVPLDGSELAEVVLPYATGLARRLGLEIVLVNVCPDIQREFIEAHREYIERMVQIVKSQLKEAQEKKSTPKDRRIQVRGEVLIGDAAERILRYSAENGVDLILIATHGESGIRRWVMGSVVDKVLQVSRVPVWLVRAGVPEEIVYDKWPRRTILVPLDGSKLAESVLPHAEAIAKQRGAELVDIVLLSVCQRTPTPPFYPSGVCLETEEECYKRRLEIEQYLARILERLKGTGLNARSLVLVGDAADEIIDYATNNRFNIIVMTTHGSSGAGRWIYGSVAEKVLLGTSSPLLLVRPK